MLLHHDALGGVAGGAAFAPAGPAGPAAAYLPVRRGRAGLTSSSQPNSSCDVHQVGYSVSAARSESSITLTIGSPIIIL